MSRVEQRAKVGNSSLDKRMVSRLVEVVVRTLEERLSSHFWRSRKMQDARNEEGHGGEAKGGNIRKA